MSLFFKDAKPSCGKESQSMYYSKGKGCFYYNHKNNCMYKTRFSVTIKVTRRQ